MDVFDETVKLSSVSNASVDLYEEEELNFIPVWRQITWTVMFALIAILGTVGNSIVIWTVLAHKSMRTITNLFIVNLAIADLFVALLNVTFQSYSMINFTWPFGAIYCKFTEAMCSSNIAVSVLTLTAISIDRYIAIMNPFQTRMSKETMIYITVAIWIISLVISTPNWIFGTTIVLELPNEDRIVCISKWPESPFGRLQEKLYPVVYMFFTYIGPLGCMVFTYGRMGLKLWGAETIGESTQNQEESIRAKRKVVKMMIVIVTIFTVCWFPFHLHIILLTTLTNVNWPIYVIELFVAAFWLAMSNSVYNPIIYCWMNSKFRAGFQKALRWLPFIKYDPANDKLLSYDTPARNAARV